MHFGAANTDHVVHMLPHTRSGKVGVAGVVREGLEWGLGQTGVGRGIESQQR